VPRSRPIVIAHRGASGYLPEHTLVSKALAVGMGADFIEQDVVATRDAELIVFHDLTLECMTDVNERFPGRARADGRYYCVDFSLAEIRSLRVSERRRADGTAPRYPDRFPKDAGHFPIPTLEEEVRFANGLSRSTGRPIGLYAEIKDPEWHREQGIDLSRKLVDMLVKHGYPATPGQVFVQCFDPLELQRLRTELRCPFPLVQLIDKHAGSVSPDALRQIANYADAIGPSIDLVCRRQQPGPTAWAYSSLIADAHAAGLKVHPYTFRRDDLPEGFRDLTELLDVVLLRLDADGLFTDFPDLAKGFIDQRFPALKLGL